MIIYDESGYAIGEGSYVKKGFNMTVSSEQVKQILLECISKCMFPGDAVEIIAAVKKEVAAATVGADNG